MAKLTHVSANANGPSVNPTRRPPPDYPTTDLPPMTPAEEVRFWREFYRPEAEPDRSYSSNSDARSVPGSLVLALKKDSEELTREPGTSCPRSTPVMVEARDGKSTLTVWLPCGARTCDPCKTRRDAIDLARIVWTVGNRPYLTEADAADWQTTAKSHRRAGTAAVKMGGSKIDPGRILILTGTHSAGARRLDLEELAELVATRPPAEKTEKGKTRTRPVLSGVGFPSVREWESVITAEGLTPEQWREDHAVRRAEARGIARIEKAAGETEPETSKGIILDPSVTPEALMATAEAFGIETRRETEHRVRLAAPMRDPRMQTLIRWAKNPDGIQWEAFRSAADLLARKAAEEEPPLSCYREAV